MGWGTIVRPETVARLPGKKRGQSEHALQIAVAKHLDRALPPEARWTAIDSAGRGPRQGARMKARGVRKGTLDTLILYPPLRLTLWIELKRSAKEKMTPAQQDFAAAVQAVGHYWALCSSLDEVVEILNAHGIPLRCRLAA